MSLKFDSDGEPGQGRPTGLILLVAAFLALALFYSLILPLFEGPDEDDHFRYAKFLADQHALPVQLFEPGGGAAGHQGWQPPLYYTLAALVISPIDTSDFSQHLWRNYAATFAGDPACCGRNIYYHSDSENFPFVRTTLAVHLVRLLSILFGAITVWATFTLSKTLLRESSPPTGDSVALAAAALVAFNPSFLFASALVSNDAPLAALVSLVLLSWVKMLADADTPSLKSAALLGALIGLALLTKTSALGLIPFSMLAIVVVGWQKKKWRFALVGNVVMLAIIALLAGWWLVRNQVLYGDPLAYRLMTTSAIFPRAGPLTLPELFQISLPQLWQTFWGGPTPGDFPAVLLGVFLVSAIFAAIGMAIFAIRNSQFEVRSPLLFLAAWLGFILVAQIQFIQTTVGADQGRYLFPAIGVIALSFALGLVTLIRWIAGGGQSWRMVSSHAPTVLIGLFFILALFVPFAYTLPAYAHPALASEDDLTRVPHPLQTIFADRVELWGYELDARSIKQGDLLNVTLYWQALAPMTESYRVFVHLVGEDNRIAGGADVIPGHGAFPTVYWKARDALRDVVQIPVAADAVPGKYSIEVGLYPVGKPNERLSVVGLDDDRALLDPIKVAPRQALVYSPPMRLDATFAGKAKLLGYETHADSSSLILTLYWQSLAQFDRDYTVFVHALDSNGLPVTQADQEPQNRNYPTSLWDAGEQIRDDHTLALRPGTYRIEVGLYRADTGERLAVSGNDGRIDHVDFSVTRGAP